MCRRLSKDKTLSPRPPSMSDIFALISPSQTYRRYITTQWPKPTKHAALYRQSQLMTTPPKAPTPSSLALKPVRSTLAFCPLCKWTEVTSLSPRRYHWLARLQNRPRSRLRHFRLYAPNFPRRRPSRVLPQCSHHNARFLRRRGSILEPFPPRYAGKEENCRRIYAREGRCYRWHEEIGRSGKRSEG